MKNFKEQLSNSKFVFGLGCIIHIILGQLNFGFWDWKVIWVAADFISSGHTYYELGYPPYNTGPYFHPPYQMPYFIYFLSIFSHVGSQRLARASMTLIFIGTGRFLVDQSESEFKSRVAILYMFNPFSLYISYFGFFDIVPTALILIGISKAGKGKSGMSGFILGIGIMTKVHVLSVYYVIFCIFFLNQQMKAVIKSGIGAALAILPFSLYFYSLNPKAFSLRAGVYHLRRDDSSLSFLTTWITLSTENDERFVAFLILYLVLILFFSVRFFKALYTNLYLAALIATTIFLISTPILYPHYLIWTLILIFILFYEETNKGSDKKLTLTSQFSLTTTFLITGLYSLGALIWGSGVLIKNSDMVKFSQYIASLIILITNAFILVICFNLCVQMEFDQPENL